MADDRPSKELEPREPTVEDLRDLCRELNQRGAQYVVVGGSLRLAAFAMANESSHASGKGRGRPGFSTALVCPTRRGTAASLKSGEGQKISLAILTDVGVF
jgi:hypothetical protein